MTLKIKNRDIVVPGELLGTGDLLLGEGTYKSGKNVHSNILGLVDSKENFIKTRENRYHSTFAIIFSLSSQS